MKYYITDLHFDHTNVIKFDNRPFKDVEEMNNALINNWNSVVKKSDNIADVNIEDNMIAFDIDCGYSNYVKTQLRYFNMSKEELIEEKQRLEEKNIIKMYNKKLSDIENMKEQVEQMKDQLNVLKAEIVATQEEAEELKRLSERK